MQQNALLCVLDLNIMYIIKGVPKIVYKILKAMWHTHLLEPIYTNLEMIPLLIFCPTKTKVSRIKPYIVMLMGKFGSTGPDFGQ